MPVTRRSRRAALQERGDSDSDSDEHKDQPRQQGQPQQHRATGRARSGRLQRVDAVLDRLRRQRQRTQVRDWLGDDADGQTGQGVEAAAGPEQYEYVYEEEDGDGDGDGDEEAAAVAEPSPPPRKRVRSERGGGSRRGSHRLSAADEYDDGSGFVVHSDENDGGQDGTGTGGAEPEAQAEAQGGWDSGQDGVEDGDDANETIAHMRLHNQLQAGSDDDVPEHEHEHEHQHQHEHKHKDRRRLSQPQAQTGAAHTASSPLAALFAHSRSQFGPVLSLHVAFHYWLQYLASALLDADASAALLAAPSTRWLLDKAGRVVEEQFQSRLSNWVHSSTWQQRGGERFHTAITQLPYITSRSLSAYDTLADSDGAGQHHGTEEAAGLGITLCDACRRQHQATHYVEIFGVPYDHQQLKHPFDTEQIFRYGLQYTREVFHVGGLCHGRLRLYHAMRHFKLRTMLLLRALLDTVGAVQGDLIHNIATIRSMFPAPSSQASSASTSFRSSSSPAARTASLATRQLAVHQRLWSMSEGYSTSDARTVRTVDVSQLDELYDIVNEACSTKLFGLRATEQRRHKNDDAADSEHQHSEDEQYEQEQREQQLDPTRASATAEIGEGGGADDDSAAAVSVTRRLLLDTMAKQCTIAELRYLFSKLPARIKTQWADVAPKR